MDQVKEIEAVQIKKEQDQNRKSLTLEHPELSEIEEQKAAELIQRNYRGYGERRQMKGMGMDTSTRWLEAMKEARYRHLTTPRARRSQDVSSAESRPVTGNGTAVEEIGDGMANRLPSDARHRWKTIGTIVKRAANDEDSSIATDSCDEELNEGKRELRRKRKEERRNAAMAMDLNYWLEMVDVRHRYGSNLRTYHQYWQKQDTKENFFYWLDYGKGRTVEVAGCPRDRLDKERVRYLSKEERKAYLVIIDKDGRLCWAKNGARIDTTINFKDSIQGIVPVDSDVPAYSPLEHSRPAQGEQDDSKSDSSSARSGDENSQDAANHYGDDLKEAKGAKKVKHVTAATIFNKLLRSSVKKNTWIFVADTNFRLYVGIKQSGAFQHSSFLRGSRISAAGLIKIKDGQLDKLSPLSGHYRPPVASFRAFVHALKEAGVDMSHVSISRSYMVLIGLEAYVKTRRRVKRLAKKLSRGREKVVHPEEAKAREEAMKDKSESAAREREVLRQEEEREREMSRTNLLVMEKLRIGTRTPKRGDRKGGGEGS